VIAAESFVFERTWGWGVGGGVGFEVCTSDCQAGTIGGAGGQFNLPGDVATDAAGNVYVADWGNDRIQKFVPKPSADLLAVAAFASVACLRASARVRLPAPARPKHRLRAESRV
jgi:hypothetical protein